MEEELWNPPKRVRGGPGLIHTKGPRLKVNRGTTNHGGRKVKWGLMLFNPRGRRGVRRKKKKKKPCKTHLFSTSWFGVKKWGTPMRSDF